MNLELEMDATDEWKRYMCIKMPISETNSNKCVTPDDEISNCSKCRYRVDKVNRP